MLLPLNLDLSLVRTKIIWRINKIYSTTRSKYDLRYCVGSLMWKLKTQIIERICASEAQTCLIELDVLCNWTNM